MAKRSSESLFRGAKKGAHIRTQKLRIPPVGCFPRKIGKDEGHYVAKTQWPWRVDTPCSSGILGVLPYWCGGEGGIRTLDTLMGYTRFPIVRARPNYATSPRIARKLCHYKGFPPQSQLFSEKRKRKRQPSARAPSCGSPDRFPQPGDPWRTTSKRLYPRLRM